MPHNNNGHIDIYNNPLKSCGLRTRICFFSFFFFQFIDRCCAKTKNKPIHASTLCWPTQRRWQRQRPNANQFVLCHGCSWITRARSLARSLTLFKRVFRSWAIFIVFELFPINGSIVTVSLSISFIHSVVRKFFFPLSLCAPPYNSYSHILLWYRIHTFIRL